MEVLTIICVLILCRHEVFGGGYYSNYTLCELTAYNEHDRALLYEFHTKEQGMILYNSVTNQAAIPMKMLLRSNLVTSFFERKVKDTNIEYIFDTDYLQKYHSEKLFDDTLDPNKNFLTYNKLNEWAQKKFEAYTNFIEYRPIYTKTHEKREILVLKVSPTRKPMCVYVVGGDTGRDWMSPAIVTNYINRLIAKYDLIHNNSPPKDIDPNKLPESLFDYYDFFFVPVLNPDGYVYSLDENHRFWMRNRQTFYPKKICLNGRDAIGVNIDRNWHLQNKVGSESECNGLFLGHSSLSEQECIGLFSRLNKNSQKMVAFIHVKSYGRMITIPYATSSQKSVNHDLMMEILSAVCNTMQMKHNETYYYGPSSTYLYNYTSNMADYVKDRLNIPMVLTVYLQHKDNFLPTPQDISILTDHLTTILNETLMLAKEIYGPLFSSEIKLYSETNFLYAVLVIALFHILV